VSDTSITELAKILKLLPQLFRFLSQSVWNKSASLYIQLFTY